MSDIRINALTTTAASSASDDYLPIDGSANGTRKLNAYSPTFGGNLTVSGDASIGTNVFKIDSANTRILFGLAGALQGDTVEIAAKANSGAISLFGRASDNISTLAFRANGASTQKAFIQGGNSGLQLGSGSSIGLNIDTSQNVAITGNLTVSGTGTSSVAGNLGVGTTSPASRLHAKTVGTAGQNTDVLTLDNIPTAVSNGNGTGVLFRSTLNDGAGTNAVNAARIYSFLTNGTPSAEYFSLALQTMNAGTLTTAATLTGSGNLLVGTTTDGGQKLQVSGTAAISGGIVGTTTNDSAAAGIVGQYVSSTIEGGSSVTLTNDTVANVTSISLTAGDWDVAGLVNFGGVLTGTQLTAGTSTTSATTGGTGSFMQTPTMPTGSSDLGVIAPTTRVSISSTTTVYLVAKAVFSSGTAVAYGQIRARRVR